MSNLFLPILKMSAVGGMVILALMLVRLILRGSPKIYSYLLWIVAAFRLLCPVTFTSEISIFNYVKDSPAVIGTETATTVITESKASLFDILSYVWLAGMVILVIYSIVAYYRLKVRLKCAEHMYDNIYSAKGLPSPFVMGITSPVIYIPTGLSNEEREYVLKHERVHIKRGDHIIKLFAFGVLTLHWFNPFCWLAFMLMSRDMEMSCDERVLRDGSSIKIYGNALLSMATSTRFPSPGPISFGEVGVKRRVKNILGWKKPALWITVISVILCIGTVSVFATDAKKDMPEVPMTQEPLIFTDTSDTGEQNSDTAVADTTAEDITAAETTTADTAKALPPDTVKETVYTPTTTRVPKPETTLNQTYEPQTSPPETQREVKPIDKPDVDTDEAKRIIGQKRYNITYP